VRGLTALERVNCLTRHDLKDVAGEDVFASSFDHVAVGRAGEIRQTLAIVRTSIRARSLGAVATRRVPVAGSLGGSDEQDLDNGP